MFQCPQCNANLLRNDTAGGVTFVCNFCRGSMVAFSFLRKNFYSKAAINDLWSMAISARSSILRCPYCAKQMKTVPVKENDIVFNLDVCPVCQQVWFDPGEIETFPAENTPEAVLKRAENADKLHNYNKSLSASCDGKFEEAVAVDYYSPDPEEGRSNQELFLDMLSGINGTYRSRCLLLNFLRLPEEQDAPNIAGLPIFTWSLVFAILAVFTVSTLWLPGLESQWGFIPGQWSRHSGLTFLTAPMLHFNVAQLLFCVYMLMLFADNVELYLGRAKFVLLLLFSMLAGEAARLIMAPSSPEVILGMNSGIAGIIAFYAVMFPNAKLCWLLRGNTLTATEWVKIYAPAVPAFFITGQVLYAYYICDKGAFFASLYPLAGLVPGVLAAIICRLKNLESFPNKTLQNSNLDK